MDNFFRYILDYCIADQIRPHSGGNPFAERNLCADSYTRPGYLIVDEGPENVNKVVDRFLQQSDITLQVALRDLSFSNSMIEATNKLLKY